MPLGLGLMVLSGFLTAELGCIASLLLYLHLPGLLPLLCLCPSQHPSLSPAPAGETSQAGLGRSHPLETPSPYQGRQHGHWQAFCCRSQVRQQATRAVQSAQLEKQQASSRCEWLALAPMHLELHCLLPHLGSSWCWTPWNSQGANNMHGEGDSLLHSMLSHRLCLNKLCIPSSAVHQWLPGSCFRAWREAA